MQSSQNFCLNEPSLFGTFPRKNPTHCSQWLKINQEKSHFLKILLYQNNFCRLSKAADFLVTNKRQFRTLESFTFICFLDFSWSVGTATVCLVAMRHFIFAHFFWYVLKSQMANASQDSKYQNYLHQKQHVSSSRKEWHGKTLESNSTKISKVCMMNEYEHLSVVLHRKNPRLSFRNESFWAHCLKVH